MKTKNKTIWDLEYGDKYYYINSIGALASKPWTKYSIDDEYRRTMGNVYLTKDEALKELKRKEIETQLKKYAKGYKPDRGDYMGYAFYYNIYDRELEICDGETISVDDIDSIIYFEKYDDIMEALKNIGKERIITDYFQLPKEFYEN